MPRWRLSVCVLGVATSLASFGVTVAPASGAPSLQVFTAGLPVGATPVLAAAAPGGGVWFTQAVPGAPLGRITTDGTIVEQPMPALAARLRSSPSALVAAADGGVWLVTGGDVLHVTPGGAVTDYASSLPGGVEAGQLAVTADGSLWFTDGGAGGAIGVISAGGSVREYRAGLGAHGALNGITAGPDGNVWFTDCSGHIGRITPAGQITMFAAGSGCPQGIVAGPDGNLWFTETRAFVGVGRITPTGSVAEFATSASTIGMQYIASGPDGRLYFTEPFGLAPTAPNGPGAIGSVTVTGLLTQDDIGSMFPFDSPWDVVAGTDGNLWLTFPGDPSAIGELTFAPVVTAGGAESVTATAATLVGGLQTNAQPTSYYFEYGPSGGYGAQTPDLTAAAATGDAQVSTAISGLQPDTTYHYRLVAANGSGTTDGPDGTFTTAGPTTSATATDSTATSTTATSTTSTASPSGARATGHGGVLAATGVTGPDGGLLGVNLGPLSLTGVVAGRSLAAGLVSGIVLVRGPGGRFSALGPRSVLPVGARIDARHGIVKLTFLQRRPPARGVRGAATAAAPFAAATILLSGGVVSIAQAPPGGPVAIVLVDGDFGVCTSTVRAHLARRHAPSSRHHVVRQLWSRDSGGSFSTHGRDSVGTVQGTLWLTADRCDGTLTHVVQGRVLVRALHVRRRVLLHAGQSYLAPTVRR